MKPEDTATDPVDDALALLDDMDDGTEPEAIADDEPREDEDLTDDDEDEDDPATEDDDDEAEDADSDPDDEAEDAKAQKPKGGRAEKRIGQLTRKARDAERERDYYKSQVEALQRQAPQNPQGYQQQNPVPTQQQYQQGQQQGLSPQDVERMVSQAAAQQVEQERFASTVETVRKTLIDGGADGALQRLANPALTQFEPEAMIALSEAKNPTAVAKAIADNEDMFERFAGLKDGVSRARLIDRIDGRLEANASRKSKPKPQPTPKVKGKARKPEKDPDDMSQAEYEVWARKQGIL